MKHECKYGELPDTCSRHLLTLLNGKASMLCFVVARIKQKWKSLKERKWKWQAKGKLC